MADRDSLLHRMLRTPRSRPLRKAWGRGGASSLVAAEVLEPRLLLVATPVTGAWTGGVFDQIGLYENGFWLLDLDGDRFVGDDSPAFQFGVPSDLPVTGDWDGDGVTSFGVFRVDPAGNGVFILDFNDDRIFTAAADLVVNYGVAGDLPVAGNWNGVVGDEIGIFRRGHWAIDVSGNFRFGFGDDSFAFGVIGDNPVVGNWETATLLDSVGVYRFDAAGNGVFILDRNENRAFSSNRDVVFRLGDQGDPPFAGDFFGDNTDEVGVVTTAFGQQTLSIIPIPPSPTLTSVATALRTETTTLTAAAVAPRSLSEAEPPDSDSESDDEDSDSLNPLAIWAAEPEELQAALLTPHLLSAVS